MISVVIPCFNESDRLSATVRSIAGTRTSGVPVEVVVVDDGSTDGGPAGFAFEAEVLSRDGLSVRIVRSERRTGTYRARNRGARAASGDVLVCTDAHIRFGAGWDTAILDQLDATTILSGIVVSADGGFRGYGLCLDVPSMWSVWERTAPASDRRGPAIAPCAATAMMRAGFLALGGYDEGMRLYAGGEGEFSVRAWLAGYELALCPGFVTCHHFKPREVLHAYLAEHRVEIVHNLLRFALLYLEPREVRAVVRHHYRRRRAACRAALETLDVGGVQARRQAQARLLRHDFEWLASTLALPAIV